MELLLLSFLFNSASGNDLFKGDYTYNPVLMAFIAFGSYQFVIFCFTGLPTILQKFDKNNN